MMQIHFNNIKERDEILDQVSAFKHIYLRPPIEMEKCKTNDNERSAVLLCQNVTTGVCIQVSIPNQVNNRKHEFKDCHDYKVSLLMRDRELF